MVMLLLIVDCVHVQAQVMLSEIYPGGSPKGVPLTGIRSMKLELFLCYDVSSKDSLSSWNR